MCSFGGGDWAPSARTRPSLGVQGELFFSLTWSFELQIHVLRGMMLIFFVPDQCFSWPVSKLLQQVAPTPWRAPSPTSSLHRRFVFPLSQGKQSPEILWVRSVSNVRLLCSLLVLNDACPWTKWPDPPQRSQSHSCPGAGTNPETRTLQSGPEKLPFRLSLPGWSRSRGPYMWSATGVPQLTRRPDAKFGWLYPAALMEGAKKRALKGKLFY